MIFSRACKKKFKFLLDKQVIFRYNKSKFKVENKKGEGVERKRGRKSLKPNKEIFQSMYYNESMTVYEIADFYGVTVQTVYNWANQFKKERKNA